MGKITMGWWMDDVKIVLILIMYKYLECFRSRKISSKFLVFVHRKKT
jgi:hypothetical protein